MPPVCSLNSFLSAALSWLSQQFDRVSDGDIERWQRRFFQAEQQRQGGGCALAESEVLAYAVTQPVRECCVAGGAQAGARMGP